MYIVVRDVVLVLSISKFPTDVVLKQMGKLEFVFVQTEKLLEKRKTQAGKFVIQIQEEEVNTFLLSQYLS